MMNRPPSSWRRRDFLVRAPILAGLDAVWGAEQEAPAVAGPQLKLSRQENWLTIQGEGFADIRINYLEAYCRPKSTTADWVKHTVIPHRSELCAVLGDGRAVQIKDTLDDGVQVTHAITAGQGEVDFRLTAHNPTDKPSEAHWAQPCVRLAAFMGFSSDGGGNLEDYLPKCFLWVEGRLTKMPFQLWAKEARYTPGQVWCPKGVPRSDVNPRPLSSTVPSLGLIGCFNKDDRFIFATAWEPYQELFQGVARCLHSDFRIGGLAPGETKKIRGKVYVLPNNPAALVARYLRDFPEHKPA